MNIKEAKERLAQYDENMPCAMVLWGPGDISSFAAGEGKPLSEEQVAKVLDDLGHNHDSSIGINWDVIAECLPTEGDGEEDAVEEDHGTWTHHDVFKA